MLDFVGWLREHNDEQSFPNRKAGFYGLDLYSLHASIEAVLALSREGRPGSGASARGITTVASSISEKRSKPMVTLQALAWRRPAKMQL